MNEQQTIIEAREKLRTIIKGLQSKEILNEVAKGQLEGELSEVLGLTYRAVPITRDERLKKLFDTWPIVHIEGDQDHQYVLVYWVPSVNAFHAEFYDLEDHLKDVLMHLQDCSQQSFFEFVPIKAYDLESGDEYGGRATGWKIERYNVESNDGFTEMAESAFSRQALTEAWKEKNSRD